MNDDLQVAADAPLTEQPIPTLTYAEVSECSKQLDNKRWHEGVTLLGYWKDGDSYLFHHDECIIVLSAEFILALAEHARTET